MCFQKQSISAKKTQDDAPDKRRVASLIVSVKASQQFEDLELAHRSQAGDTEAFGELVTKYRTKIFTMVCGMVFADSLALNHAVPDDPGATLGTAPITKLQTFFWINATPMETDIALPKRAVIAFPTLESDRFTELPQPPK